MTLRKTLATAPLPVNLRLCANVKPFRSGKKTLHVPELTLGPGRLLQICRAKMFNEFCLLMGTVSRLFLFSLDDEIMRSFLTSPLLLSIVSIIITSTSAAQIRSTNATRLTEQTPPTLPALKTIFLPTTLPPSKRTSLSYTSTSHLGNGWTTHATTYTALLPIAPASQALSLFYTGIFLRATTYSPTQLASYPYTIGNGALGGELLRLALGGFEMRFFSMNTRIPWGFVMSVAARLRDNTKMGYTGLHYGKFEHETGLVIFVTVTAVGLLEDRWN